MPMTLSRKLTLVDCVNVAHRAVIGADGAELRTNGFIVLNEVAICGNTAIDPWIRRRTPRTPTHDADDNIASIRCSKERSSAIALAAIDANVGNGHPRITT